MLRWGGAVAAMMVACRGRTEVEKTWCGGGRNQFARPRLRFACLLCSLSQLSLCSASASTSPPLHYYQATTLPHSSLPSSHRLSSAFPLVLRIL